MNNLQVIPSSFRDISGQVFQYEGQIVRTVDVIYRQDYDLLMSSGLYRELASQGYLVEHQENDQLRKNFPSANIYKVLKPKVISYISYPYEWCFSALKEAALLTLDIQKTAIRYGMTLKDASAYNIQFSGVAPVFIDTLSFRRLGKNQPWVAYRQFCQHFLLPLSLMAYRDLRLNFLLKNHLDGIPLDLGVKLLPLKATFNFHLFINLHLQRFFGKMVRSEVNGKEKAAVGKAGLEGIIDSLINAVSSLKLSESNYYEMKEMNDYSLEKGELVNQWLALIKPQAVIDLGGNVGTYSRLAAKRAKSVVSTDFDCLSVERNYQICRKERIFNILPLIIDLVNPSPGIGWRNQERLPFESRFRGDTLMALALIHHLYFSNNLPFDYLADFFASSAKYLLIEFIDRDDEQVKLLMQRRDDDHSAYTKKNFEKAFLPKFRLIKSRNLKSKNRSLYLWERIK